MHYQEWPNLWPSKRKGHFIKHLSSPNLSTVLWLECFMVVKLIIYKINRLQERALRLIYNDHISSFKELLSKDGTFTIHEQNIQNLGIEMFKSLNDLSTPDFSELFQLNESLHGLRSNGPQKLCIPNINSVRFGKGSIWYFDPVIWNSIPAIIRNAKTFSSFEKKIRKCKPSNCQCQLCVDFLGEIGFTNIE